VAVLVMTLSIPIVLLTLLIVICGQQFYGLLHLEFFQEAEKEESKLDFAVHENIVLLRVLRTRLHQVRSHHIGLILEHDLRFVLQVTLSRNGIRKVNPGNLGALCGLQVNISDIL
jgi:Na+-transporting methylmalonyl-CoA/oxaloacetate decarboxylase gamma subunit